MEGEGRSLGTFKDQLISVGSLFVISGNPLEPGSMSAADNQGKQRLEEEMNACPCTCTTKVAVDLTVILYDTAPRGEATKATRSCHPRWPLHRGHRSALCRYRTVVVIQTASMLDVELDTFMTYIQ